MFWTFPSFPLIRSFFLLPCYCHHLQKIYWLKHARCSNRAYFTLGIRIVFLRFYSGERWDHLKGIRRTPQEVRGRQSRIGTMCKIKWIKVLEDESISDILTYYIRNINFYKKNFEKFNNTFTNFWIFEKLFVKIQILNYL